MSGWDDAATWTGDGLRREVFFFESGGEMLHGSLYAAHRAASTGFGLVICPSWGIEADRSDALVHGLALAMAELGGAALVFQYPGYADSSGALAEATMEALSGAALRAVVEGRDRAAADRWILGGFALGASVAALASAPADVGHLLLLQPALRPSEYFGRLERSARRVTLGPGVSEDMAYGYPLPRRILAAGDRDDAAVSSALARFAGSGAVVEHEVPPPQERVPGFEQIVADGTWRFGATDHSALAAGAVRWLERLTGEERS